MRFQTDYPDWDDQIQKLGGHGMQATSWAGFQRELGRTVFWDRGGNWAWCGYKMPGRGVNYLYIPNGPAVTDKVSLREALVSMTEVGKVYGLDFVRFDLPTLFDGQYLQTLGLRSFYEIQPRWTWVLDLSTSEQELRASLSKGNRNLINRAERTGLTFRTTQNMTDIKPFLDMTAQTGSYNSYVTQSQNYLTTQLQQLFTAKTATLYYAEHQGSPVASAIALDFGSTRYYLHAAAFQEQNRRLQAARPLVWKMILDAKTQGKTRFDFYGVAPKHSPNHPYAALSAFKRSFGGYEVEHSGTWDLPLKTARYGLYRIAKTVERGVRKTMQ